MTTQKKTNCDNVQNSNYDKTSKIKLGQYSKTKILTVVIVTVVIVTVVIVTSFSKNNMTH